MAESSYKPYNQACLFFVQSLVIMHKSGRVVKKGYSLEPFITGITSGECEVATREQGLNLKNAQDYLLKHFRASVVHTVEAGKLKYFQLGLCPTYVHFTSFIY